MDTTLFLVALRVVGKLAVGLQPSAANALVLSGRVSPHEATLPQEEICYLILKRELNVSKRTRSRGMLKQQPKLRAKRQLSVD